MASRSKKKQLMRPQGGQMSLETNMAMAMSKAEVARMAMEQDNSFTAVRERQNAAFRMSVDARKDALRMIETSKALSGRVQEVYEQGRQAGFKEAAWPIIKCCMAGACLTLQNVFDISDDDRIVEGLKDLHDRIVWALNYSELVDDVLANTGIELHLDDPLEPVQKI